MSDAHTLTLTFDSFWISPYVFSCFVALREKGLAFNVETVALEAQAQHAAAYQTTTLTGRVPALRHGDFVVAESTAIVEYLDDAFLTTTRMLPSDLHERARARQVQSWLRSDLLALRHERATHTMFYARATEPLSPSGVAAAQKLLRVAGQLIDPARSTLFSQPSIVDADLAFMLHRLILNGDEVPAPIRAFADAQWQRPSVQEWVTHTRAPYVPYGV